MKHGQLCIAATVGSASRVCHKEPGVEGTCLDPQQDLLNAQTLGRPCAASNLLGMLPGDDRCISLLGLLLSCAMFSQGFGAPAWKGEESQTCSCRKRQWDPRNGLYDLCKLRETEELTG